MYRSSNRSKLDNGLNYNKTPFVLVIIPGSTSVISNKLAVLSTNDLHFFYKLYSIMDFTMENINIKT